MKNLKNAMSMITLALVMLMSVNVNAQNDKTEPVKSGPIVLNPGNSTQLEVPSELKGIVEPIKIIIPNSTHRLNNVDLREDYNEAVEYAIGFNNAMLSKNKPTEVDIKNYNTILDNAPKDEKYKLVLPLINSSSSTSDFLLKLEKIKSELLQMDNGFNYYVKLNYTIQSYNSFHQKNGDSSSRASGCLHSILTGAAAGGVIGSWFPGVGTTIGAAVGIGIAIYEEC